MSTKVNLKQALGSSMAQHGMSFHSDQSNMVAGSDININLVQNVNNSSDSSSSTRTRLKNSLAPVTSASYNSYEARQRSECFQNTRTQVLSDIEAWIHADFHQASIYVLDGVAGIGKSTIAQTVAVRAADLKLLGGSFFFSRDENLRRIAKHLFPTIAYQLACYDDQFAARISLSLEETPDAPAKQLDQQMSLLWLEPLELLLSQKSTPTLLVVDALDECEENDAEELLSVLGQHVQRMKGLKILITMRPEAHLRYVLDQDKRHERFRLHEIEDSIVHSDIRLYLQFCLSREEISKVLRNRRTVWQPKAKEIDTLCGMCGTLFIIAATATKFILDRKRLNPERQFARLLDGVSTPNSSDSKHTHILDETYVRIILAGQPDTDDGDDDWFRDLNKVLGALIALANPIPCNALASLLDMNWEDIEATLSPLHSLVAPSGSGETMMFRVHHKSFPDFITNRERIRQVLDRWNSSKRQGSELGTLDTLLWVDIGEQHLRLAKACLRVMNHELKWNMMGLTERNWYKDTDDISHVIPDSTSIPLDLAYASLQWASHLRSAAGSHKDLALQSYVGAWASRHILAWMEVMVMLNQVNGIYDTLGDAVESLKNISDSVWAERARVKELLLDASRFVQQGSEVMRLSPMHIYRSCLPFTPTDTALGQTYHGKAMLRLSFGTTPHWSPLLATLIGHTQWVTSISFSADNRRLASGSRDKTIRIWDAKTGAHVSTLLGHTGAVSSVAFSSDGSQLASGWSRYDGTIRLWDVKTGALVSKAALDLGLAYSIAFSRDHSRVASASGGNIQIWDAETGAHILTISRSPTFDTIQSVSFSRNGSQLASGCSHSEVELWNADNGRRVFALFGHSGQVSSVAFCNDGCHLASGSSDKTIRLWNTNTGAHVFTLAGHTKMVRSVAFSSDDSRLASGSFDRTIRIWDAKSGAHVFTLTGHTDAVNSVAFSSDGTRLASASNDGTVRLWDPKQATHSSDPIGHLESIRSIAFSHDGSVLASASDDNTIRFWDLDNGAYKYALVGHSAPVYSVTFSSDDFWLASGSGDRTIRVWEVKTGAQAMTLAGHSGLVTSVAFSSDGSGLASGSVDGSVCLWDVKTGACISTLIGHSDLVWSVAFASNDSLLASVSQDETIRLWNANTGAHLSTLTGHSGRVISVAFYSDDSRLASGSYDGTIQLWDAKAGTHMSTLTTPWISQIISFVLLQSSSHSQLVDRLVSRSDQSFERGNQNYRIHILALVKRKNIPIIGLVIASSLSGMEENLEWEVSVVCWFPPDLEVRCFAVDYVNSKVAVGCVSGRVLVLDFSPRSPQLDF